MKIVHIATTDSGGAGIGMVNLHKALLEFGIDSKVLVAHKTLKDDSIIQIQPNYHLFKWSKNRIIRKIQELLRCCGLFKTIVEKWDNKIWKTNQKCYKEVCFTSPYTKYDITQHFLLKDADIIHLHWVGDFLDYKSFFSKITKPIVWTLRDENPGLGGFHYLSDKTKYIQYYDSLETIFEAIKCQVIQNFNNLTLVALSNYMIDFCKGIKWLKNKKIHKIYNSIDNKTYHHIDKGIARKALQIDNEIFVVLFVAVRLMDERKGFTQLINAIDYLDFPIKILCVGKDDLSTEDRNDIICYGSIDNPYLMSIFYSAADVFVNPTMEESFGKTIVESLLCGTPVISTNEGIAKEIINDECGYIISDRQPSTIAYGIKYVRNHLYDSSKIINKYVPIFSPEKIVNEHIIMYNNILTH